MDSSRTATLARRRAPLTAMVAALTALLCVASASAAKTHHGHRKQPVTHRSKPTKSLLPAPTGGVVQFNREEYRILPGTSLAALARDNQVIVLGADDGKVVRKLHRLNPHLIVLMYQFVLGASVNDPTALGFCVTPQQVQRGNWYLRNSNGQTGILLRNTPGTIGVDPGNRGYERACAKHAAKLARRFGFNGVMLDGVDARLEYEFPGIDIPEYASLPKYLNAMSSLLTTMRDGLHKRHVTLWANIGAATATPGLWQRWAGIMDGAMEESWTDGSLGLAQQLPDFPKKLSYTQWSEAHHRYVVEHSWNMTEAGNTYGLAAMLLVADGRASYSTSGDNFSNGQTLAFPEFDTARGLGLPTGHYSRLGNGAYIRPFQRGLVVVNASTQTVTVPLGGTYSGSGLSHASSATLGPTSGLILLAG